MDSLSTKQWAALELLALGTPVGKVAETIRVDRSTIRDWCKIPAFQQALSDRRAEVLTEIRESSLPRVAALAEQGLDVLEAIMVDKNAPHAVRANIALKLLGQFEFFPVAKNAETNPQQSSAAEIARRFGIGEMFPEKNEG